MKDQIHKRLSNEQVRAVLEKYSNKEINRKYAQELLEIKKTQFFDLLKKYQSDPVSFSIDYERLKPTRRIGGEIENMIIKELEEESSYIANKDIPIKFYNYSYIQSLLKQKYGFTVSVPTIIGIAKKKAIIFQSLKKRFMTTRLSQTMRENSCSMILRIICLRLTPAKNGI